MIDLEKLINPNTKKMKSSLIRELVASTKNIPGLISLAGGFPAPQSFPAKELANLFKEIIDTEGKDILQYGSSEGDDFLKKNLIKYENLTDTDNSEILITAGSTNAIYFYVKTLIEPGDVIISEAPSFLGSLVAFDAINADVVGIEMDENGMRTDLLKNKIKTLKENDKKIKFIYLIPEFQNPTGITMSLERRHEVIEIARKNNIIILEDNPYGKLRYSGKKIKSLYDIARNDYNDKKLVTLVKSFSKVLGPGLRVAFAAGDETIIKHMGSWNQKINVSAGCVDQRAVSKFIERGLLDKQIEKLKEFYAPLLKTMLDSLTKYMPTQIKWTHPEGGMFIWITLPENISGTQLFNEAKKHKVSFIPGIKSYPPNINKDNEIRLNFSYPTKSEIEEGVKRLSELIKEKI